MVRYIENGDAALFDSLIFRKDKNTGYYLNSKTHKRLHVYVWEFFNGKVPEGYHVHHSDLDKNNNEPYNLVLMKSRDHLALHGQLMDDDRYQTMVDKLKMKALPKAIEWHKSEKGREWHKKHYELTKDYLHRKSSFKCTFCGSLFISKITGNNKFCSNKCRSANRRKSGVDNESRICICCGGKFITNKYSKARTCSRKCRAFLRKNQTDTEAAE